MYYGECKLFTGKTDKKSLYQLLLFHFQEKQTDNFFNLIEETISCVNSIFLTVFKTFLKDMNEIINTLLKHKT